MLNLDDFNYVLQRLDKDVDSPTGQALKMILMHGKLPIEAVRTCNVPMVRLMPVYEKASRIASALHVTTADGFTEAEVIVANRALVWSRAKESAYIPTTLDLTALEMLRNKGGSACKASDGSVDELPGVPAKVLMALHHQGAVEAQTVELFNIRWTLMAAGIQMLEERFKR